MNGPDEKDTRELPELIEDGISQIENNIASVNQLPLTEEFKESLLGTLSDVHRLLVSVQPILDHLEEVRNLIIMPVQRGLDQAFERSNKWGVRGIIAAISSILITLTVGGVGFFFTDVFKGTTTTVVPEPSITVPLPERSLDRSFYFSSPCSPAITEVLFASETGSGADRIYIVGKCYLPEEKWYLATWICHIVLSMSICSLSTNCRLFAQAPAPFWFGHGRFVSTDAGHAD